MKKILILGAGVYQVPLIKRAKERGYYVMAASNSKIDNGTSFADEFLEIDTTDKLNLFKYSEEAGIDAVTTTGTDVAVPSIGFICDKLQLPGLSEYTAYLATNKIAMKSKFIENNVPTPGFRAVKNPDDLYRYAKENGFPLVVKAPDSSGSKGLTIVAGFDELDHAFDTAMNVSRCGSVIVEEYLEGREFSTSIVVINGDVVECFIRNKKITKPPIKVTYCASCPADLPGNIQNEIYNICAHAVKSLNIKNAICETDLIITDEGAKIIELGARLGSIGAPEIINLYYGVNLYDTALDLAFNTIPTIPKKHLQASAYYIIASPHTGTLNYQSVPDRVLDNPNVVSVDFDYPVGMPVREFKIGADRIGSILVTGESAPQAERFAAEVLRSIRIDVDTNVQAQKAETVV